MRSARLLRIAAALVTLIAGGAGLAHADGLDDVLKSGVIKIAVPQDFPPFGSVNKDLQPIGYDVDIAALIAKELGVKLDVVPVTSANRIPYLQTHKVDLIVSSLGKTPEREKTIDFTSAYAPFFSGVFGPATLQVAKPEDMAGKTVGVTRGTLEDLEITKSLPATATIRRFEDNNTTIAAFLSGQVPLIATGNVVAAAILAKDPPVRPEKKFIIKDSPCYIGLNKGENRLRERVNAAIAAKKKSGDLDALSRKWFGQPLPTDLPL
jgi:polar amino acid transport system substrate-binding protein